VPPEGGRAIVGAIVPDPRAGQGGGVL
jgi:hypothetical protein